MPSETLLILGAGGIDSGSLLPSFPLMHRFHPVRLILLASVVAAFTIALPARTFTVVVYNVENLFDIDGVALFSDYRPDNYRPEHLFTKLRNTAETMRLFQQGAGPEIILFQEIEADQTPGDWSGDYPRELRRYAGTTVEAMLTEPIAPAVRALPAEFFLLKKLADRGMGDYEVAVGAHQPNPSGRTLVHTNVTFSRFPIREARTHHTAGARGILETRLDVGGHDLYVFNNHWKAGASREADEEIRLGNARVLRDRIDAILRRDRYADILIGGDLNSHYNQNSRYPHLARTGIKDVLGSQGDELALQRPDGPDFYNLWYEVPPERRKSDVFRGEWGTLMHLLVSRGLYDYRGVQYVDNSFGVAKVRGLNADLITGLPLRWSFEGSGAGFSDHFPLFAHFRVVDENRPGVFKQLTNPSRQARGPAEVLRVDYAAADLSGAPEVESLGSAQALNLEGNLGRVFQVDARVAGENPFRIELFGEEYTVWSHDRDLRIAIYRRYSVGDRIRFHGEFGRYQGQWQFVIRDRSWIPGL
ncbi:MAG: hypothetical protein EA425_06025 [Puniceicoccaceae bacterium]|nr:MAG: hypothetical protein EA425_06025 [Puniceicoccaceae bacterium]